MTKVTKPPRRSSGEFVLGRGSFSKISAVEGIRLSSADMNMFGELDRKKLSPKARREVLTGKFRVKR